MRRILILFLALGATTALEAQHLDSTRYAFPVEGVAGLYSANFGEMRPDHFHSGVDVKTDGAEGKRVVAVADGYVSRIFLSPWGYGRALYVVHPDGTTSVYGHLSRFRSDIERLVHDERLRTGRLRLDISCEAGRFEVRRGEEIARSGNTGTSYGPHLHFELRDTRTQRTLNPIARGVVAARDGVAPYIVRIHYAEVDTVRGVPVHGPSVAYDVVKRPDGSYALRREGAMPVGGRGCFVLETTDRKDGVSNTFGIYRVRASIDGEPFFEYRMDGFTFDQTRYCNAVSCYAMQAASRNEAIRLSRLDGNEMDCYPVVVDNGLVRVGDGARRRVEIEVEDDCGNRSSLRFEIEGRPCGEWFRATADSTLMLVDRCSDFRHEADDVSVRIPAGALYESLFYRQDRSTVPLPADSTIAVLSPVYTVFDRDVPLHAPATISVRAYVPPALRARTTLGTRSRKGRAVHLGGTYADGRVTVRTRRLGEVFVVADTVPPRLEPLFKAAELKTARTARFRLSDNFSGVQDIRASIDGKPAIVDYLPVKGVAAVQLDKESCPPGRRRLTVEVTDGCGNLVRHCSAFDR